MSKRFTVMVIPENGEKAHRIKVRRGTVGFVLTTCLVFLGILSFFVYSYFNFQIDAEELRRLRLANAEQRHGLQQLATDVELMREELAGLAESEARVLQLADFDIEPKAVPIAMGGIPEQDSDLAIDELQKQISQLQVAIELRRKSQEDVRSLLSDRVSVSRATPNGWPTKGWITSYFGMRQAPIGHGRRFHEGIDIAANTGTPIFATADGVVARVEFSRSYGKTVIIDHGYGYRTLYAHNSKNLAKRGMRIKRGDKIAEVGNTGVSTGPHVHYEVQLNGVPINPRKSL
ncbi:Murein DD-endopeptidase MepM and murein hydrolase activator NlpD, contain LysM domain [Malonomonas rubra DSM 5091]|uniref:Murein DD-endopeptidase MepM and murein hydrolase activator NlpD, contain LysM domain n=1 Tax=Malonomonas rubra DSM 5091 TaxID=1122189 RepID=A0A1M6BYF1_MALRU|nr:M23 family metallopeptidase [Malonomonas rubra]SHI53737.1 Murein DD-endopeptidase MepM and murein hydrolase activator NlpD, contain LysM domain [Malonomonas rubra DSM 5091]